MISARFFKSSLIYSVVGALPYATGFLLLPWFTHLLTPQQFGANALYIALMFFVQILASFGLDITACVLYFDYKDDRRKVRSFIGTIFLGTLLTGLIAAILFFPGGLKLFNLAFTTGGILEILPFGLFTILSGVFNNIFKTYSNLLVYRQEPVRFLWLNLTNFALTIGLSLGILYEFPYTLYGPILGRLVPAFVMAGVSLWLVRIESGFAFDRTYIRKITAYSTPVFIYALLTWIVSYIDRFLIVRIMGDTTYVGIFDIAVKLVLGLELIMAGLVNTINPRIFSAWKEEDLHHSTPAINRYYHGLTALFMVLIPVFIIAAPMVIPLIIHKKIYHEAFGFIGILAAGYITRVWLYMFLAPLMYFKKTWALPRVFLISAAIDILAGVLLIRYFGLMGAVWTSFLLKPVQALLMYLECRKIYSFRLNGWKVFYIPSLFVFIVLFSESLVPHQYRLMAGLGQLMAGITLVYFAYRRELIPFMRWFSAKRIPFSRH